MKSTITVAFCLMLSYSLFSQIQKGTKLVGGTLSYANLNFDKQNFNILEIAPMAGYSLSNRFMLGAGLNLNFTGVELFSNFSFGVTPFARYYFNGSGTARFYGQTQIGYQTNLGIFDDIGEDVKILNLGLSSGADILLNDYVAIEGAINFNRYIGLGKEAIGIESDGYNKFGFNVGFVAFLNNKKK